MTMGDANVMFDAATALVAAGANVKMLPVATKPMPAATRTL